MAMELMLSHDFIKELARELEFDQGAHRHTADLNNGNDIEISVDVSTRCRAPSAYPSRGGSGIPFTTGRNIGPLGDNHMQSSTR